MDKVFAIGDIHGENLKLQHILKQWNPDNQQLILLGDLIDRGDDSYGVIQLARQLKDKYGAIIIRGNHEHLLLNWLDAPDDEKDLYYPQGGRETLRSFFKRDMTFSYMPTYLADLIETHYQDDISFIKELPYYYEWQNYVFVHGGVNLDLNDWKKTNLNDFCWIRKPFHYGRNETGKTFVFGHTLTRNLNEDQSDEIWISPCQTKIGIDGGAVFGGQLHALAIDGSTHTFYSVDKHLQTSTQTRDVLSLR